MGRNYPRQGWGNPAVECWSVHVFILGFPAGNVNLNIVAELSLLDKEVSGIDDLTDMPATRYAHL